MVYPMRSLARRVPAVPMLVAVPATLAYPHGGIIASGITSLALLGLIVLAVEVLVP